MPQIRIHIQKHVETGLLAATSDDLSGFHVHARTPNELITKLGPAFSHFMAAIGQSIHDVRVTQSSPAGFWPPTFIAQGELDRAA